MNKVQRLILGSASIGIFSVSSISAMAALAASTVTSSTGRTSKIVESEAVNTTNTIDAYSDDTSEETIAMDITGIRSLSDSRQKEEYS
ncbi:MAG: hypothetical protein ABIQ04_01480 [Candidatus Saccharimonadales bacterium]